MIEPEQELVLHRAGLLRQRAAVLRRRRTIAEIWRRIEFEALWADPCRRAAHDDWRRSFYEHRPHLYEPVPKMIGRRTLLASLGACSRHRRWPGRQLRTVPMPFMTARAFSARGKSPAHASTSGTSAPPTILTAAAATTPGSFRR